MEKFGKNKKGSIVDLVFIGLVLLVFGIVVLVGSKIGTEFNTKINDMNGINESVKAQTQRTVNNSISSLDSGFLILTIFIALAVLVLAALVRIHPIFIPIFILGWIFLIFIAGIFSNIYQEMTTNTGLTTVANELTFITNVLNILPLFIGVVGILLMMIMYKLWSINQ